MQGKIIKGIAGFYYVHVVESGIYECKAKGIFRKDKVKPLVGDDVEIEILSEEPKEGNIVEVNQRKNELIRPAVANVDQALVVFAVAKPDPHLNLLDRFLVMMQDKGIKTILCFNKEDIGDESKLSELAFIYKNCGYPVIFVSAKEGNNIDSLKDVLRNKTTVIAGPSGVGKSTILNCLYPEANAQTGKISKKIERGKHTTRHSELFTFEEDSYIMDTPGFSSLLIMDMDERELKYCFPEFDEYEGKCKYNGCDHIHEPGCSVKEALGKGLIAKSRYDNYVSFYQSEKEKKRY
ncbi:MAG: ribosome small subunit-dependent GTPase A [Suipraeoptans sp.]